MATTQGKLSGEGEAPHQICARFNNDIINKRVKHVLTYESSGADDQPVWKCVLEIRGINYHGIALTKKDAS